MKRVYIFPENGDPPFVWTCEFADIVDDTVFMRAAYRRKHDLDTPEAFEEVLYKMRPGETVGIRAME